eukprot:g32012.t1
MDEMFVEFFDAIDELSDNDELEGTSGMGLGLVIPKLKTDQEIAAHYSVPLPSLQQLKVDFPECPAAELSRFLARKSVSGDVSKATKLRSDLLRFTVLLDCRPHTALGYDAKPVWRLWTHISAMAKIFQAYFPERLQRFVIYPAGDLEMGAFRMFKGLLSTETVKRVRLLYSKLGYAAAAPPPELLEILDRPRSTSDVGPILHEGFYKLAAAVTRPEPTLRQKATALQKSLEMQLKCLRQKGADPSVLCRQREIWALQQLNRAERVETFLTQEEASVDPVGGAELQLVSASAPLRAPSMAAAAERAREEMELCIDTLLSYARETSTESRERRALLDSTSEAAAASIRKFLDLIERQAEAVREAGEKMEELQGRIRELEEDNDGLRRVVQQALKDEGEMQRQKEEKETEVEEGQQKLSEAESRSEELSTQLQKVGRRSFVGRAEGAGRALTGWSYSCRFRVDEASSSR